MATIRVFKQYVRIPFLILGLLEYLVLMGSIHVAYKVRFVNSVDYNPSSIGLYVQAAGIAAVMLLSMMSVGLYSVRIREGVIGYLLRFMAGYFLSVVFLSVIFYLLPDMFVGRGVLVLAMLISGVVLLCSRIFVLIGKPNILRKRILVLGAGKTAKVITELRRKSDQFGFIIIGFVHLRGEHDEVDKHRIIHVDVPLSDFVIDNDVDEIVVAVDDRRKNLPIHELLDCKMRGVDIADLLTFFERESGKIRIDQLHPSWFLFSDGFRSGTLVDATKRIFDIVVSSFLLLISLPFILFTIIAIKLEEGWTAPILYRQVRVGQDGKPFQVLKFRSMRVDAEKSGKAQWAVKNDNRVTKVGGFIRKVRIDELPQIINVFRGDMSFVGPRPERPEFVVELSEKIPYFNERHRVKPGITGWAQLKYPYGASEKDALEKLQYDLFYVKNYTLLLDFMIMLQTAEVVLFSRGGR